ncbi:MAG: hypothetical protein ABI823_07160 [Bryobacteraceae bacterium]
MLRLATDASAARQNATLSDAQRKQLDSALESLQSAGQRRRKGERPDREKMRQALRDLNEITAGEAFRPEDRSKVREDLMALREFQKKQRASRQAPAPKVE